MQWQLLLGISILTDALGRIVQRIIMKGKTSDPVATAIVYLLLCGILLGLYSLIAGLTFTNFHLVYLNLLLVPVLWGLSNILIFKSLKHVEASVFTILFASRAVWIILLSMFYLRESFSLLQGVGTILIIFAVFVVSWQGKKFKVGKGEFFALLAAIGFGVAIVNDAVIVGTVETIPYLSLNFISSGLFIWLISPKSTPAVKKIISNISLLKNVSVLSIIYAVSATTYLLAYTAGKNAAQIGALYPVSAILTVLLAVVFLKENSKIMVKIVAVILSFIGVMLVS